MPTFKQSSSDDLHDEKTASPLAYPPNLLGDENQTAAVVDDPVILAKSRGVIKMELLVSRLNMRYLILLYGCFALLAYTMALDQYSNRAYLTQAVSVSFGAHALQATIGVIKSVCQAISQPPIAKVADVFGRVEAYCMCVCLYVIGYIIVASSPSLLAYAIGNSIYIPGITGLFLLQNIIISDMSSLRNRVFWSIFPSLPGTINVWVSGDITSSFLAHSSWRWGIGMFCILIPVIATPIILTLYILMREQPFDSENCEERIVIPKAVQSWKASTISVFWQLDLVGLVLLVGGFGLLLVTITMANSKTTTWSSPQSIAMLVVGCVSTIVFVAWEKYGAKHPLMPFYLFTNRTVIACMIIALLHPLAGGVAGGYLYTQLVVAGNQSVKSATRLTNIPSFVGTLTAFAIGFLTRYTRRLKPVIMIGFLIQILGLGLMTRYRQSSNSQVEIAMVQLVRGLGSGCIGFPVQAAIQSAAKHEYTAAITATYLLVYYMSGGIGSSIGGGIWTNLVPNKIDRYMNNDTLSTSAYKNPIGFAAKWAYGTPERMAVARAHDETQKIMVTVAAAIVACSFITSCFLENIRLPDSQSRPEVEDDSEVAPVPVQAVYEREKPRRHED